jgi:hypothetical protein
VLDHGLVCELDQRLRVGEGLQQALGVVLASRLEGAERHTRGRRRVPNPPTRIMAVLCEHMSRPVLSLQNSPFMFAESG